VHVLAGLGVLAVGVSLPGVAAACAGCRNPNLPMTRLSTAQLTAGQLRASAILSATSLNVVHPAGCADPMACSEVPVQPPFLHDQTIQPAELRAVAELGLHAQLGVELQIPVRVTRTSIRYTDPAGGPFQPLDPEVHHRNEILAGLGDPWLLGRWGRSLAATYLTVRAGLTVPLGRTEPDPFVLGGEGKPHQHIQFGNGTVDPVAMVDLSSSVGKVELGAYGQAQWTLYRNRRGFQAGDRYFAGAQAGTLLPRRLTVALGLDVLSERPERWGGKIQQDGNLGRTELLGAITMTRPFGATIASLALRFPLYRKIVHGDQPEGRLSSPIMLSLILSRTLRLM
jgi:hypothetical protein